MNIIHHSVTNGNRRSQAGVTVNYYFAWIVRGGILLSLVLGFFHLMLLNSLATQGFALEELKTERISIQQETEGWDIALAIPMSLYALQSSEQVQEMEKVDKRNYLYVREGEVAMLNNW